MRFSPSFNINRKLIVLVLAVSLVAIAVTTVFSFNFADTILKNDIKEELVDESNDRGKAVRTFVENRISVLFTLSKNSLIQNIITELNKIDDASVFNAKKKEKETPLIVEISNFQISKGRDFAIENVDLIGNNGRIILSLNPFFDVKNFTSGFMDDVNAPIVEFVKDTNNKRHMVVFLPIFDNNDNSKKIGMMVATLDTSLLDQILLNRYGLQMTGEVYLVNKDRLMISDSIFIKNAAFNQRINTLPVSECFENGQEISGEVYRDYRGIEIFGVSYCATDLGLVVLTEIDESEILSPLFDLQEKILVIGFVLMVVVSGITYVLSRRLSQPIMKLRDAANEIAKGNFDVRTNIKSNDEIGQLSSSFDFMAENLKQSIIALRRRDKIIRQQEDILLQLSGQNENCCVCIVDIIGSTITAKSLTEKKAGKFYEIFINSIADIVRKYNGKIVKNLGDALLFYFPIKDKNNVKEFKNVIDCCLEICDSNAEINKKLATEELPGIAYRISSTYGEVSVASVSTSTVNDIFGETVNKCSKINRNAFPNTLVIGKCFYEKINTDTDYKFLKITDELLFKDAEYEVYLVSRK
ncbi:MAG TPA: cache domain-containing protein [Nitrosopumilaceae archaeon]|nr:cache domain-containing protein [Nitrosopumilaceae archaeon]